MPDTNSLRPLVLTLQAAVLLLCATAFAATESYPTSLDSEPQPGVPKGSVEKYSFTSSRIFPGTRRDYWVYVPAQYDGQTPACVYVNQDGIQYNAPVVFDNLIAKKEMPVTIGVFVTPGVVKALATNALDRFNRSFEYDGLGGDYARFLLEELLPEVARKKTTDGRPLRLSAKANDRCIAGSSSGAICAFTVAWERPDAFARVFSTIGTYVGLRGGQVYPTLIRKFEPRPLRIFLQDGAHDLNIYGGDWWMANQTMERALLFAGYEIDHAWGEGEHNTQHGTAVFPDAMRFLWKDWPQPVKTGTTKNAYISEILVPGEGWQMVSQGHASAGGCAVNRRGELFFHDPQTGKIHRLLAGGTLTEFAFDAAGAAALAFGPGGQLYAASTRDRRLVAYDESRNRRVVGRNLQGRGLVVRSDGLTYVTEPDVAGHGASKVWLVKPDGTRRLVDTGMKAASGATLSPDQSLLYVADAESHWVYSYQIQPDGMLAQKQRYFWLHCPDDADDSGAAGMACDRDGRLYVATRMGIQVCDQAGRVECILPTPCGPCLGVAFGGEGLDTLFALGADTIYQRKVKVKGAVPSQAPIKPLPPRL